MEMRYTGSISRGKTAEKHNTRECYAPGRTPANIDRARTHENVIWIDRSLEDVYEARFGDAAMAYSALQVEKGHPERQVPDYLAKVRADKKLQPMYEFVVQIGNVDEHPPAEVACEVYTHWLDEFQARWGANFAVKQAIIHLDEATPHMHLEVVPVAESKRGLSVQNSMNKAVKQAGFSDYKDMLAGWDEVLTECMERQGIERVAGDRERQMGGVDIDTYRRSMAAKVETEQVEQRLECLRQEVKQLESTPQTLAESARALSAARGDAERERELAEELQGLRKRNSELERQRNELERDVVRLERDVRGLRARLVELERRVKIALYRVSRIPDTLSRATQQLARKMGVEVYAPGSFAAALSAARGQSEALEAARSHGAGPRAGRRERRQIKGGEARE